MTTTQNAPLLEATTEIEEQIDAGIWPVLRELLHLRRDTPALRRGGIQWLHLGEDSLVLLRTHPEGDVLVHLARAAHGTVEIDLAHLPGATGTAPLAVVGGAVATADGTALRLEATGPGASLTLLPRSASTTDPLQEDTP